METESHRESLHTPELWSAAVAVARKEGLNQTARELHVAWDDLNGVWRRHRRNPHCRH